VSLWEKQGFPNYVTWSQKSPLSAWLVANALLGNDKLHEMGWPTSYEVLSENDEDNLKTDLDSDPWQLPLLPIHFLF